MSYAIDVDILLYASDADYSRPLAHEEAARNVEALLAVPHCRVITEEEGFWDRYRQVTQDLPTRGQPGPGRPFGSADQPAWCRDGVHP